MASVVASQAIPPTAGSEAAEAASRKDAIFQASPFGALTAPVAAALRQMAEREVLTPGRHLGVEGEPARALFVVGTGRVRVERVRAAAHAPDPGAPARDAGVRFAVAHRGPGEILGESGLVGNVSAETAIVADAGDALAFSLPALRRLVASEPAARDALAAALVAQHRIAQRRLEALLLHGVEVRLARWLLDASKRWGVASAGGQLIAAGFTHADVALLIGSTRETVTLLLGKLRRSGVVTFDRRRVVIRDRAELERLAAADG